jgi:hypothetical protein
MIRFGDYKSTSQIETSFYLMDKKSLILAEGGRLRM